MSKETGGPAFPIPLSPGESYKGPCAHDGMTLRDYFAIHASDDDILAVRQAYYAQHGDDPGFKALSVYQCRYLHADAMLTARAQ